MSVLKKDLFARIPEGHPEEVKKLLADETVHRGIFTGFPGSLAEIRIFSALRLVRGLLCIWIEVRYG